MNFIVERCLTNPIVAKMLMIAILIGGISGIHKVQKEAFPTAKRNFITITMAYPGANPSEIEQQVVVRIEESIAGLTGIFRITSESRQGFGKVDVETVEGYDSNQLLNEIKSRVDAIHTFPKRAERPVVTQQVGRPTLMYVSLYGDADRRTLKYYAYEMRDEMALLDGIAYVTLAGIHQDQVNIEISEDTLRRYQLTFDEISTAIKSSSMDLSAGSIRTDQGTIQIQTRNQANTAEDFGRIPIISNTNGSQVLLGDIASIKDGLSDLEMEEIFEGKPAVNLQVFLDADPHLITGTENAEKYIEAFQQKLPPGIHLSINFAIKTLFDSRLTLLTDNALSGLILVFIVLMLFLRPIIAMWVTVGIAIAFSGTLWLLPLTGISINMMSMFGFLIVLGIVVDDAIVVGESIYSRQQEAIKKGDSNTHSLDAALLGTQLVLKPVTLSVITTLLFFTPILDAPTEAKPFTLSTFYVIALSLAFSLVEALLILPSHLAHIKPEKESRFASIRKITQVRQSFAKSLESLNNNVYQPGLQKILNYKAATLISFLLLFSLSVALVFGGWLNKNFMPSVPNSFININVTLPDGSPYQDSKAISYRIRDAVEQLRIDKTLLAENNNQPFVTKANHGVIDNQTNTFVGFTSPEERIVTVEKITERLRELIGPIPEAKYYTLGYTYGGHAPSISFNINMQANDRKTQLQAVQAVKSALASYEGVKNIESSLASELEDLDISLKPQAELLGVTTEDIANQVRQAFYGEEVQRIPRAKEDVRVMLRYSEEERRNLQQLNHMRIRTEDGTEIPLEAVAEIQFVPGFTQINRLNRRKNITVTADVENGVDAGSVVADLQSRYLSQWRQEFSGFNLDIDGSLKTQAQFGDNFNVNFTIVLMLVYALLAISFRSYMQPFIILSAIPFGFLGASVGHFALGHDLSLMSAFGFLACSGVVVNDNLVLLDRINHLRKQGLAPLEAVLTACKSRFRPIILTSMTTFIGLTPILFETSGQAQFLIPMVIALSFGVLFASPITLMFVPTLYLAGHEIKHNLSQRFNQVLNKKLSTASY